MIRFSAILGSVLFAGLGGCGESPQGASQPAAKSKPAAAEAANPQTPKSQAPKSQAQNSQTPNAELRTADYIFSVDAAEFSTVAFSDFDFENEGGSAADDLDNIFENADVTMSTTGVSGNLGDDEVEGHIKNRELVIIAPVLPKANGGEPHAQQLTLTARDSTQKTVLLKITNPTIGAVVEDESHFEDEVKLPELDVQGLSSFGAVGETYLTLRLEEGGPFNRQEFRAFIYAIGKDLQQEAPQTISELVDLDSNAPALSIDKVTLQGLLKTLPDGVAGIFFELPQATAHNNVTVNFIKGSAVLSGQLINRSGAPVSPDISQTGPLEILITGTNLDYRRIVPVSSDGKFKVDKLPSGEVYNVMVSDLRFPNLFGDFAALSAGKTEAKVDLIYTPGR